MGEIVRGRDTYTHVEIAVESSGQSWGSDTSLGTYYGIPIISEDLNIERDPLPDTDEISSLGAREALESGKLIVVGSITIRPRWDSVWFNMLLSNLGYENTVLDKWVSEATSTATGCNTHIYSINQTVPEGFHIRVWKAGPNLDAGTVFTFKGCLVTEMNWEQPNDNHPTVTFTFVGKEMATTDASTMTTTDKSAINGSVYAKLRDLDQYKSATSPADDFQSRLVYRGSAATTTYTALSNVNTFTINVNRGIDFDPTDVDTPDTVTKPGAVEQREVTIDIEGKYEQTAPAGNHPYHDYMNDNITGFAVLYSSATYIADPIPYACQIVLPRIVWTEGEASMDTGGTITYSVSGTAVAPVSPEAKTLYPNDVDGLTDHQLPSNTEFKIAVSVKDDDELDGTDASFGPGVAAS